MAGSRTAQTALCRAGLALGGLSEISLAPRVQTATTARALATLRSPAPPSSTPSLCAYSGVPPTWRKPSAKTTTVRTRCLSTSAALCKKKTAAAAPDKRRGASKTPADGHEDDDGSGSGSPARKADPSDPSDMGDVEEAYARLAERAEEKLRALRHGGRFNPDALGRVPVVLEKGAPPVPLSEAALVDVQGGRVVQLTLFEPGYRRAVMSAIQSSPQFNQQPQPDPDDDAILTLKVEPERLDDQLRAVKETCHALREGLRRVTAARQKKHTQWGRDKAIQPDDVKMLNKNLQKMQDAKMKQVDTTEASAVHALKKAHGNAV